MKYYFQCPHCRQNDEFYAVDDDDEGLGCAMLFFGGLLPFAIYQSRRVGRVQCAQCRFIFRQPPIGYAPLALVAGFLLVLIVAVPVFLFCVQDLSDIDSLFPASGWIIPIEQIVRDHARATVYSVGGVLAITFVTLLGVAIGSNRAKRNSMSATFRLHPGPSKPAPATPAVNSDANSTDR